MHRSLFLLLAVLTAPAFAQRAPAGAAEGAPARLAGLREEGLTFVENRGQWADEALFLARTGGADVWVTADAVVFDFYTVEDGRGERGDARGAERVAPPALRRRGHVVAMRFEGGRARGVEARGHRDGTHSYFFGDDPSRWASRVPLYDEVVLKDLYPGVDLCLYADGGLPRYDLLLAPGADLSAVRVRLEGAEGVSVTDEGVLRMGTTLGPVEQRGLLAYQEDDAGRRRAVGGAFVLRADGALGFTAEGADPARPLVIDPLLWATFLGGPDFEYALDAVVEPDGSVTVAGYTGSADFPTTPGAYDTGFNGGNSDAFVARLSADGAGLRFATFLGGHTGYDVAGAIALGRDGGVVVAGYTESPDFPVLHGAFDTSFNGGRDAFLARLSPDGTALTYSTLLGGTGNDTATAVALDCDDAAAIAGYTGSPDFPTTPGAFDETYNGSVEAFAVRFTPDGSGLHYATFLGGTSFDFGRAAALGGDGSVTVVGETGSPDFPTTPGAFDETYGGSTDAFVARLTPDGDALVYATFLGGEASTEWAEAVALTREGGAVVAGLVFGGPGFPVTPGAFDETYNGGDSDAFVAEFMPSGGDLRFATLLGGEGGERCTAVLLDSDGSIALAGNTNSPDFPTTPDAYDDTYSGENDVFAARLAPRGDAIAYSTFFGGATNEILRAAALGGDGSVVLVGEVYPLPTSTGPAPGPDFPTTPGAFAEDYNGGDTDAFVARLDTSPALLSRRPGVAVGPERAVEVWPNPLGASATLAFEVGAPVDVVLSVYDALGREVARLVDGPVAAGRHEAAFEAVALPSGVYLARLAVAGEPVATRRMTVLR